MEAAYTPSSVVVRTSCTLAPNSLGYRSAPVSPTITIIDVLRSMNESQGPLLTM